MSDAAAAPPVHRFPVRVYWEDTDASGIVYHATYLRWAERARTELLRTAGFDQSRLLGDEGVAFAVRHCEIDYRAPARLDDTLEVATRILDIGGATVRAEQAISRAGAVLARLLVRLACIDRAGRPVRVPVAIRALFEQFR